MRIDTKSILFFIFLLSAPLLFTQEKDSVVILSKRVGSIITREERDFYKIFPAIENYNYSIVYKTTENKYYIRFNTIKNNIMQDTILFFHMQSIMFLAEKIDNYDLLVEGNYKMGTRPGHLTTATKESINEEESKIIMKILKDRVAINLKDKKYHLVDDMIDFDSTEAKKIKMELDRPIWELGFGLSSFSADLNGLNNAFTVIENIYRDQGYIIKLHSNYFSFGTLLWYRIKILFTRELNIALDAAKSTNKDNNYYSFTPSVIYDHHIDNMDWFKPWAGIGVSFNYFKSRINYGNRISIPSSYGSYTTLDYIEASGSKIGFTLKAGGEVSLSNYFFLNLFVKYLYIPEMNTSVTNGLISENANVKLSSAIIGAMISIQY